MHFIVLVFVFYFPNAFCLTTDFLFFENFDLTKKSLLEEQVISRDLKQLRQNLVYQINDLNKMLRINQIAVEDKNSLNSKGIGIYNYEFNRRYTIIRIQLNEIKSSFYGLVLAYRSFKRRHTFTFGYETVYTSFKNIDLVKAAVRGVIMLQETFNQNIDEFLQSYLTIKNNVLRDGQKLNLLEPSDFIVIARIAFDDYKWFDTAIKYLKTAIELFYSKKNYLNTSNSRNLEDIMSFMKKKYSQHHNEMLSRMDNPIGPEWKLYPTMVNPGIGNDFWHSCLLFLILQHIKSVNFTYFKHQMI